MKSIKIFILIAIAITITADGFSISGEKLGTQMSIKNDAQPKFHKVKGELVFRIYGKDGRVKFTKRMIMARYAQNMGKRNEIVKSISLTSEMHTH